jgi:Polyketide cyclase / dehydrase and lipid transport
VLGSMASRFTGAASAARAAAVGAGVVLVANASLLLLGKEGFVCIAFSLPLTLPVGALGGYLDYRSRAHAVSDRGVAMLLLLPAGALGFDVNARPPVYEVRSSIEIAASAEQVWRHVIAFAEMPEPAQWYFHTGLAYPKAARLEGTGVGARRYCDLSTGPLVESVEVWDPPRVLRFRVTDTPAPMREWSPYGELSPKHLRGYMVSKEGEFRLIAMGPNRTRVEGTSWYQHGLWPAQYWRLWSDAIIHRIHLRVLEHIRTLAEADARGAYSGRTR